ncbi:MAG TPA: SDR family oxidoreductase [Flavipsychrobacter sp.]|nr:SDR family oxidoreductase [Flavipsychrobacter sp.]
MSANGKWALVTGGSIGIGYELAKLCAKDSFNLILVARDEAELQSAKQLIQQEHKVKVETIAQDLFDVNASQEIYDFTKSKGYEVSILINNAGQGEYGFFHETDIYRDLDIINLNVIAPVYLVKLFAKDMIAKKEGRILNLASIVSKNPSPLLAIYSATKAFIYSFSMALRNELKDHNISVTALLPGATDTDFFDKAGMLNTKEYHENATGDPAAVAEAGYKAMMNGDEKVVSEGLKNKMMANMANVMPDSMIASNMRENHMKNIDGSEGKEGASQGESVRQAANSSARNPSDRIENQDEIPR